jgi:hypothetical protein
MGWLIVGFLVAATVYGIMEAAEWLAECIVEMLL